MWDLSCRDWEDRILTQRSLMPALSLFENEAAMATQFYDGLRLPDVRGMPELRDASGPWYREIVAALFGSRDPATNIRHVREIFALVPKGNSKTSYSAALMITALLMNQQPRAEFLLVGPTQATADLAFSQAAGMIEADPQLKRRFKVTEHIKEIKDRILKSKLKVKTFDLKILTGQKPVGVLLDELHVLGRSPHATKVIRQIRGGLEKNTEGFFVIITTQSDEQPAGAFKSELKMARAIRDGRVPGRMLPILYEFPRKLAKDASFWQDPANWPMVMPNLGRSLQPDSLLQDWETERQKGEDAIRVWASQHLNIEIGVGLHSDRWAGADWWEQAAAEKAFTLDELIARCEVVVVGIDGGGLNDLLGLAVVGRERGTDRLLAWMKAWAHPSVLKLHESEEPRLMGFAEDKDLVLVDKIGKDVIEVADLVEKLDLAGVLADEKAIGVDQVGIGQIVKAIMGRNVARERIVGIKQGWELSGAIKTSERRLAEGNLIHTGSAMMDWCVGNAKVEPAGNAIRITKQTSGTAKIDPLMAMFNAVGLMELNPPVAGSIYENAEAYRKVFGKDPTEAGEEIKPWSSEILKDPRHPDFAEHKKRFEAWQDAQPEED